MSEQRALNSEDSGKGGGVAETVFPAEDVTVRAQKFRIHREGLFIRNLPCAVLHTWTVL